MNNKTKTTKDTKNTKRRKNKKNTAILIVVAVLLCIAISLLYAFMKGWFEPKVTPTPSNSQSAEPSISVSPPPSETETETETETPTDSPIIENPIPEGHIKIDKFDDLKGYFEYMLSTKTGIYGLSVLDVTNNKSFNISTSQQFDNSSVYKIAVVLYAYEQEVRQGMPLDTLVEYTADDYDEQSAVVGKGSYSDTHTIQKLCEYILKNDDRTALNMLLRVYGKNSIETYMTNMGMSGSSISFSPYDMVICLKKLKDKTDSGTDGYAALHEYMSAEILTSVSTASIVTKDEDKFSYNGSVIVYAKNTYIVSMSANDANITEAENTFMDIYSTINTLFTENEVIVEKSIYSHALVLDRIVESAKQTASRFKSYIMMPDRTVTSSYISEYDISFPRSDEYSDIGVTTYRGNNYRDSGFFGNINISEQKLEEIWSYEIGGMTGAGSIWPGVGWTGQPCIVKWDKEMLGMMNVYDKFKNETELIEVIYATLDGNIYFLDLKTGEPTRDYIYIGVPIKGTLSIDPRGYPLLYVGQGLEAAKTNDGEERYKAFGYRIFSLIDSTLLHEIRGYDTFAPRPGWGAFDSSGILDIKNDTYYECGENGVIYIIKLNTVFNKVAKTVSVNPEITKYKYLYESEYAYGIESSPSIYEKYMYFTDNTGMLICLDLESLKILWAYNTGDDTDASVALDVTEEGVFLYTANEVDKRGKDDYSNLRKFNALTGELLWQVDVPVFYVDVINGGALASPIIGKGPIKDLVIFNICKTLEDSIWSGRLIAIDKETGQIRWEYKSPYSWSSPVAVYTEDNKAYIVYCEHNGKISLIDALTGTQINQVTLSLGRQYITIEATPAIYGDILVVGTYAQKIYGVRIK